MMGSKQEDGLQGQKQTSSRKRLQQALTNEMQAEVLS
jgi:hypothetical protein